MTNLAHRVSGYALLSGAGLEIGALHEPAQVPAGCRVSYFDVMDAAEAARRFPELAATTAAEFVRVDHLGDLDQGGLAQFADEQFDFVIASHVLEHVANPIKVLVELFRITRTGGCVVIAVPDKDHTYDRSRELTSFLHLWNDYLDDVRENTDAHYLDFLTHVGPHVFQEPAENLPGHLQWVRGRREHAHVWNSDSFAEFLRLSFALAGIRTRLRYLSPGTDNHFEYFSVWQKAGSL